MEIKMDDLKSMTDQQLAERIVCYVENIQELMDNIADVLEGKGNPIIRDRIYKNYKQLKQALREDKHYLSLNINSRTDINAELYNNFFKPSIREAAACGFYAPSNCRISQKMYDAVNEALYQLTRYHCLDKWQEIAEFYN